MSERLDNLRAAGEEIVALRKLSEQRRVRIMELMQLANAMYEGWRRGEDVAEPMRRWREYFAALAAPEPAGK